MTKSTRQLHWDSYYESEPVSICASAVSVLSVCLYVLERRQQVDLPAAQATLPPLGCTPPPCASPSPVVLMLFGYFPVLVWVVFIFLVFLLFPVVLASLRWYV